MSEFLSMVAMLCIVYSIYCTVSIRNTSAESFSLFLPWTIYCYRLQNPHHRTAGKFVCGNALAVGEVQLSGSPSLIRPDNVQFWRGIGSYKVQTPEKSHTSSKSNLDRG